MYFLPYNKNLKAFSRHLRNNSTLGEVLLWQQLKAGKIRGYKFNRQKPLGNYIVDSCPSGRRVYCKKLNLVIEVDGEIHFIGDHPLKDKERQQILEGLGLSFLRFEDRDVRYNLDFVIQKIEAFMDDFEGKLKPHK